ncbi:MAG: NUDIX domain-containing protein [Pirellulaceae bacterium]|nr:NUDIX domain-containing protein [Pirellulaceae bacterium]
MSSKVSSKYGKPRHGAVGIVVENNQFLVIRRSQFVRAPNMICFPGGTIEPGETPQQAVVRELNEELGLVVTEPLLIWQSRTSWGTLLDWLVVDRVDQSEPQANEREVAEFMWIEAHRLLQRSDLLGSMPDFFGAWASQVFQLPSRAGQPDPSWQRLVRRD